VSDNTGTSLEVIGGSGHPTTTMSYMLYTQTDDVHCTKVAAAAGDDDDDDDESFMRGFHHHVRTP